MFNRKIFRQIHASWNRKNLHTTTTSKAAIVIDGSAIARQIQSRLKTKVETWIKSGQRHPKLVIILVGQDAISKTYIAKKLEAAKYIGIESSTMLFKENITEKELIGHITTLNKDRFVDGILVQLPLPKSINETLICQAIEPSKDVDGFHSSNLGNFSVDEEVVVPATALAVRELIIRTQIETKGKNAVVIGRSKHVGLPIALLLHSDGQTGGLDMTTTICHRYTPHTELEKFTKLADIIVTAAGVPGLISKEMIKPGSCIIDVGITRVQNAEGKYRLVGDVDYDNVKQIAGHITPVPGGVGPMTVSMLMRNIFCTAVNHSFHKN